MSFINHQSSIIPHQSSLRLIFASLLYHWRVQAAVACGVVAGTAVLTGALLVGDSMRGSLRDLTLKRLGRIDEVLLAEQFFRAELAAELAARPGFKKHFDEAVPAILLRASLDWEPESGSVGRANRVNLVGCDARFGSLGPGGPQRPPEPGQIVLNQALADKLLVEIDGKPRRVKPGDRVMLRLPQLGTIPADSLLGRKKETVRGHPFIVSRIIPPEGLGRFSLHPSQQRPLNAYVSLDVAGRLRRPGRVNAILVAGKNPGGPPSPKSEQLLQDLLRPTPDDYGIRVVDETKHGYFNITSDRMLLDPAAEQEILRCLKGLEVQPALTYLANTIAGGGREIPYSTITAIDFTRQKPLGPFLAIDGKPIGPLADGQIVLNEWAAADLGVEPGAEIEVTYFEPESTHGTTRERTARFRLAAIARLAGPADDRAFTPEVPGVTDKRSIKSWDPPFQPFYADRVRIPDEPGPGNDDDYWQKHGTTPKAFISLAAGRRLWESRFGRTTSLRVKPAEGMTVESLRKRLALKPAPLGFVFQPVKRQGLAASKGATSFSRLFLGFSFFIIAAAMMLVALLFRLGIDGRAEEIGILLAVGFRRRRVAGLLAGEGLLIAAAGSLVGIAAGAGYAALMLGGLSSKAFWLKAVVTPFLRLHLTPRSLLIGYFSGLLVALAAILWAMWQTRGTAPRQLLAGRIGGETAGLGGRPRVARWLAWGMLATAVAFGLVAMRIGAEMQAGAFFGAGAMVLIACLALVWTRLRSGAVGAAVAAGRGNVARLALRNLARNPGRSTLTIGLVASASFLIVSISAFHIDPKGQTPNRQSGNGGFALVAESDQPIYQDLNTQTGRERLGFKPKANRAMEGATTFAVRVRQGDDASCLNLYKPQQPRVLGLPGELIRRGGFVFKPWVDPDDLSEEERNNPWLLLERDLEADAGVAARVPVVLDAATATYSLHVKQGREATFTVSNRRGEMIRLQVVGVLPGSIFQGDVLMSERALLEHFPEEGGYRFFLVEAEPDRTKAVQDALDASLAGYGLVCETSGGRLARFLVVQNTYLKTFQSLGGLGLLLGTFGLAAVELRNVFERRRELALLRATGFRRRLLAWLVMLENGLLLVGGLACGLVAAGVAVLPHMLSGGASIPWISLAGTLLLVLAVGLAAGLAAVRATLAAPLLAALRGE